MMGTHELRALLQRHNFGALVISFQSVFVLAFGLATSTASTQEDKERKTEIRVAGHLPIRLKIRKPERIKDLNNKEWLNDFEVEVTNTGVKPIYYFYLALSLEDVKTEDGTGIGYTLRYGRVQLADFTEPVRPDDAPLNPGESCVLAVPSNSVQGWKKFKAKRNISDPKRLTLRFQLLNHGDGTGFIGPEGSPLPRERSSSATCGEGSGGTRAKEASALLTRPPSVNLFNSFLQTPVDFLPANFFEPQNGFGVATPRHLLSRLSNRL